MMSMDGANRDGYSSAPAHAEDAESAESHQNRAEDAESLSRSVQKVELQVALTAPASPTMPNSTKAGPRAGRFSSGSSNSSQDSNPQTGNNNPQTGSASASPQDSNLQPGAATETAGPPETPVHVQVQQILRGVAQQGRYSLLSVVRNRNMDGFIRVHGAPGWVEANTQRLLQSRAVVVVFNFDNPAERQDLRRVVRALRGASPRLARMAVFAVPLLIDATIITQHPQAIGEVLESGVLQFLTQVNAGLFSTIEVALLSARVRDQELIAVRDEAANYLENLEYMRWQWVPSQMRLFLPVMEPNLAESPDGSIEGLQFVRSLGQGAFGMVHEARTPEGDTLAVKVMRKENAPAMTDVECIYREIQILSTLPEHPHLARLEEVVHGPEAVYVCLSYGGPSTLYRMQLQQPNRTFSLPMAQDLFGQVADAVAHMHENIIFHRDIKPENIAVNGTEEQGYQTMLVDFGLTASSERPLKQKCGSLPFAAPEILSVPCRYFGGPADAFALGMLLFEMVRGQSTMENQLGWNRRTEPSPNRGHELRQLLGNGPPDVNREENEPREVTRLLSGLLQVDPARRMNVNQVLRSPWLVNAAPQQQLAAVQQ